MSFTFAMAYKPSYQYRQGTCKYCTQGIAAGERVMVGTGFWNRHVVSQRFHVDCYMKAMQERTTEWFFKNDYVPCRKSMAPTSKAELNRLRAKRYYIKTKGGDQTEVREKLEEIERRIALVKDGKINEIEKEK